MKLNEVMVAIVIFVIVSTLFASAAVDVRKGILKGEGHSRTAMELLKIDEVFRKEIKKIEIPYWKNFEKEFAKTKLQFMEHLEEINIEGSPEIVSLEAVLDEKYCTEGIRIEWKHKGKTYVTQEYIKQRIIIDE